MDLKLLLSVFVVLSPIYVKADNTSAGEIRSYKNFSYYEVKGDADKLTALVNEINVNGTNDNVIGSGLTPTDYFFIVSPTYKQQFESSVQAKNLTETLINSDYSAYVKSEQAPLGTPFSWNAYYDLADIHKYLHNVSNAHRQFVKALSAGFSYEQKSLLGVQITTGDAGKPAFMIECGIHAREWVGPASCTYFIDQLLTSNDTAIRDIRDDFDWHIFPVVNPDGYHYSYTTDRFWTKSRSKSSSSNGCHGVDLNRNFETDNWGVYSSSNNSCDYEIYSGPASFSEPETKALKTYISQITNLQAYVSVHASSPTLLFPFDSSDTKIKNYDDLKSIGNASIQYALKVNGTVYRGPGPSGEIANQKSSGEAMDWVRKTFDTPVVFTVELGGHNFDLEPSLIAQQGKEFTQIILGMVTQAKSLGYFKTST